MELVKDQHPDFYNDKISSVYGVVRELAGILLGRDEDEITLESRFVEDLDADTSDTVDLAMDIGDKYGIEIPDKEAKMICSVYDMVVYFTYNTGTVVHGKEFNELIKDSLYEVSEIYWVVRGMCREYFKSRGLKSEINSPLSEVKPKKLNEFKNLLDQKFIHDTNVTERLMQGTIYDVVGYLVERDVKLQVLSQTNI